MAVNSKVEANDRYALANGAGWLVAHKGTTVDVCNYLGITGQADGEKSAIGATLTVPVTSYYGRGASDMWEWIKLRLEEGA